MVDFNQDELEIIQGVFHDLVKDGLKRWVKLLPAEGEQRSDECSAQWRLTEKYNEIRHKAAVAIGKEKEIEIMENL